MDFHETKSGKLLFPAAAFVSKRVKSRFVGVYLALLALDGMIIAILPFFIWIRGSMGLDEQIAMVLAACAPIIGIFAIRLTANLVLGMIITTALTTAAYMVIAYNTGGLSSFVIPWFMTNLAVQGLFGSSRLTIATYAILMIEFTTLLGMGQLGLLPEDNTAPNKKEWAFALSIFTALTAMAIVSALALRYRVKSKTKLKDARDKAEAGNRAKSVFLSNMSHELRTPLNAILGFGGMLQLYMGQKPLEKQKEWAGHIITAGNHLSELISDVLDLARVESNNFDLQFEFLQPREIFRECFDLTKPSANEKHITLEEHPNCNRYIRVDRRRLRQVILNLMSNAVKYTDAGGNITIGCQDLGDRQVRLFVRDTGRGIAEDDHIKIFTPFFRTPGSHNFADGAGVGLALVAQLCSAMEGTIHLESTPNQGSIFYIDFPAAPQVEPSNSS